MIECCWERSEVSHCQHIATDNDADGAADSNCILADGSLPAVTATIPIRTVTPGIKRVAIQSTRTATRRLMATKTTTWMATSATE
jgi:hypothetical protein